jgi:hypothetical protein
LAPAPNFQYFSRELKDAGVDFVGLSKEVFEKEIQGRHNMANTGYQGGKFFDWFISDSQQFNRTVLIPALAGATRVERLPGDGLKVIATLPYNIVLTGTYRGQPNLPTNEVAIYMRKTVSLPFRQNWEIGTVTPHGAGTQ